MSLPRYEKYKESGLEWLGDVPTHWKLTRTKHVCTFTTGWTPPTGDSSAYDGENMWANISDLGERRITETAKRISDDAVSKAGIALSPEGSLLFSFKLSIGQVSFAGRDMYTNEAIATFRGAEHFSVAYGYYAFPIFLVQNAAENIYGAKLLNQELMRSAFFALPPIDEQQAIAAFLDRETAKIDALIAEQEKLLALLVEKRQAIISHAVTHGLNSDAPLMDSSIPWLGEVPAHWRVKSIGYILDAIGDVDHFMPVSVESGVPYLMTGDLKELASDVSFDDCKQVSYSDYMELSKRIKSEKGDVIMARYATIGTAMYVDIDADFLVSYSCVTLKADHLQVSGLYLFHYMKADAFRHGVDNQVNTNTQSNVGIKDLRNVKIVLPPVEEQAAIAAFIHSEASRLGELKAESERAITLLKERRSALIAAAVTGQIDVRESAKDWAA